MSHDDSHRAGKRADELSRLTHAGGLVYRIHEGVTQYLLITAKGSTDDWVLPKGHIEPDESPVQTAIREVAEETGVRAEAVDMIQEVSITVNGMKQLIRFYLMKFLEQGASGEQRESAWLDAETALQRVRYPESRQVLRAASTLLPRITNP